MILKFATRNILKRPVLNLIKVIGLGLSLSSILIIVLFLRNQLTFDNFHKNSDRIYRLTTTSSGFFAGNHFARVYKPDFVRQMAEYFPEIDNYVRLSPISGGVVKHYENYIIVNQAYVCDSTFFEVFDAELIVGNPFNILDSPGSMVVSESFAKKAFGKGNPVGQILTLPAGQYYGRNTDFTVKGIMKDFPQNSHFHPEFITTPVDNSISESWAWTYLLLSENAGSGNILKRFKDFYFLHREIRTDEANIEAHLQKITDIHLYSNKLREIEANSNMAVIYTLSLAALILLLIALANFTNLSIGMKEITDKYLFISKVSGASIWMNLKYFFTEGIMIVLASVVIGGFIVTTANIIIQRYFGFNLFAGNAAFIISVAGLFCILAILAGILPLLKQSKYKFATLSDNKMSSNSHCRKGISKFIIVLQYTISIVLIVAVIVIRRQTNYALDSSMGVETNNIICFEDVHSNVQAKFEVFKEELIKYNSIESVSAMFEPPGGEANDMFQFKMEGYVKNETNEKDDFIGIYPCDFSFAGIFNLSFLGGNNFTEKNEDNEGSGEYIINESAMKRLNYTNPVEIIGKEFQLITNIESINIPSGKIIGVVKDFHLSSLKKEIDPLVLFKQKNLWISNIVVSFQPGIKIRAISDIESVWTKMFPEYPFQYEYISSMYEDVYKTELLQAKLLSIFTFIALFICSMGLLGLSLLTTQRRTKEIGIRKINGARISEVMIMLNWDILKWIVISCAMAIPLAYLLMKKWLEAYANKIALNWWIFALAGMAAVTIAILTISAQSWKTSVRNPSEALRYE